MVMKMDEGLDTGAVAMVERLPIIGPDMTAGELHDALALLGADLMVRALAALERGGLQLTPQSEEGVTYAAKIDKAEARIDWRGRRARCTTRSAGCRRFPAPGSRLAIDGRAGAGQGAALRAGRRARARPARCSTIDLTIACGDGAVRLVEVQRAGKAPMNAAGLPARRAAAPPARARLMPRYKLIIEYDGTPFSRLAAAGHGPTVQGALEEAIEGDLRRARRASRRRPHRCRRPCAGPGRACRSRQGLAAGRMRDALNAHLRPHPCRSSRPRSSPRLRRALLGRAAPLSLSHPQSPAPPRAGLGALWHVPRPLDADAMHDAAQLLLGKHDFTTFRAAECQAKSPVKTLDRLDVVARGRR